MNGNLATSTTRTNPSGSWRKNAKKGKTAHQPFLITVAGTKLLTSGKLASILTMMNKMFYFICSPTVATTLKNLVALYRKIGKMDAAEVLEDLTAARINKEVS